jgi:hypothetical protein
MSNIFNGIIRLRRDNDYNYDLIKDTFIPADGEVCLIDTVRKGLRAKVGDGKTVFAKLEYTDAQIYSAIESVVVRGYYKNGDFYADSLYSNKLIPVTTSLYINITENNIYTYNGTTFEVLDGQVSTASSATAGIMKLYGEVGQNTDGTMTQKAITDELNEKIEI